MVAIFYLASPAVAVEVKPLSKFVKNVITHVLLHEVAHALIREFDLPILGNEENVADGFASHYITKYMRGDAVQIITSRAKSWVYEDSLVSQRNYDMMGEHELDIRRAYNVMCSLYGADPSEWKNDVKWVGFSENDLNDCSDFTPKQIESWQRVFARIALSEKKAQNVEVKYGKGPYIQAMKSSGIIETVAQAMRRFNWPQPIVLRFDKCAKGAFWSRASRTIQLCDDYVARFIEQEKHIGPR